MDAQEIDAVAKAAYENQTEPLEGHHCPAWEALPEMMREHLRYLILSGKCQDLE